MLFSQMRVASVSAVAPLESPTSKRVIHGSTKAEGNWFAEVPEFICVQSGRRGGRKGFFRLLGNRDRSGEENGGDSGAAPNGTEQSSTYLSM